MFAFWAPPIPLYSGQEVIARLIRGSTTCAGRKLFPCERVRQRSFLELWRVWFGVPLHDSTAIFPYESIPGEVVLADSRGPKLLVQLEK